MLPVPVPPESWGAAAAEATAGGGGGSSFRWLVCQPSFLRGVGGITLDFISFCFALGCVAVALVCFGCVMGGTGGFIFVNPAW